MKERSKHELSEEGEKVPRRGLGGEEEKMPPIEMHFTIAKNRRRMLKRNAHILMGTVGAASNKTFVVMVVVNVEAHFFGRSALFCFVLRDRALYKSTLYCLVREESLSLAARNSTAVELHVSWSLCLS